MTRDTAGLDGSLVTALVLACLAAMPPAAGGDGLSPGAADGITVTDGQVAPHECFGQPCQPCQHCCPAAPYGLVNSLLDNKHACWSLQADALLLWRDSPPSRAILQGGLTDTPLLNADDFESGMAAGPRLALFRTDACGNAWELTWLQASTFSSLRDLPQIDEQYVLSPPGIYGNANFQPFDSGTASLTSSIQSAEINHHLRRFENFRWLVGFRWLQWQEKFRLEDSVTTVSPTINDLYRTSCINDIYGVQIGFDARVISLAWLRVDSVMKGGAMLNNAVQSSLYSTNDPATPGTAAIQVSKSPASAFVGELGFTGIVPVTDWLDFRFGYLGFWLYGIAQPTQQLSGQKLTPGEDRSGSITTNGGVVVQGLTLGVEARW